LYRSPAAIAWGRENGTTAAMPAHPQSAVTLSATGLRDWYSGSLR
jgi:hypothetical protein